MKCHVIHEVQLQGTMPLHLWTCGPKETRYCSQHAVVGHAEDGSYRHSSTRGGETVNKKEPVTGPGNSEIQLSTLLSFQGQGLILCHLGCALWVRHQKRMTLEMPLE